MKNAAIYVLLALVTSGHANATDYFRLDPPATKKLYKCKNGDTTYLTDKECTVGHRHERGKWLDVEEEREKKFSAKRAEMLNREKIRRNAAQLSSAIKQTESQNGPATEVNARPGNDHAGSSSDRSDLHSLIHCRVEYEAGYRHIFIYATDETGTYAINGKARAVADRMGWFDGYRKFNNEQMQILLRIGMAKC